MRAQVMKQLKILFTLFSVLFLASLGYLISLPAETTLSAELNTDIPRPVAFKQLVLTATHQSYLASAAFDSVRITFHYFKNHQTLPVTYRPVIDFNHYRLIFKPVSILNPVQPFKTIKHTIHLQKLADGSTSIHWGMHYRISGLLPRLLNRYFWQAQLRHFLKRHIAELKTYFP